MYSLSPLRGRTYQLYFVPLLFSLFLHWQRDFVTFLSLVFLCNMSILCVHQWGVRGVPCEAAGCPGEGLTRRVLPRWFLQGRPGSRCPFCSRNLTLSHASFRWPCSRGNRDGSGRNPWKQAEQLRVNPTQVVWPPAGLEQYRLRQLQPHPAGHDQDGEVSGASRCWAGRQHVQ